jgi:hypothetical protein
MADNQWHPTMGPQTDPPRLAAVAEPDGHQPPDPFPLHPADVLAAVAAAYGITVGHLTALSRRPPAVEARLVAYVLLHDECRLGWAGVAETVGRSTSGRTHISRTARNANPAAVAALRARLRPDQLRLRLEP